MYPWTHLPPPLSAREFYILFALARQDCHAYRLKWEVEKDSLGSLKIPDGTIYPLLVKICAEGLVDIVPKPKGASVKKGKYYAISEYGRIRLGEELQRLHHVIKISEAVGMLENQVPSDIARLLLEAKSTTG